MTMEQAKPSQHSCWYQDSEYPVFFFQVLSFRLSYRFVARRGVETTETHV
ncbi:hypothetical protein ALO35_200170 [Pseudomonas amygdali pv. lachrymans]|nr:hypothetical protein ALO35_200170 [Pseudomonas amygdali pv. lachrymans]